MNQILVTKKLYITPELKRKKKIYKFYFFLSVFLLCTLVSFYIYAEYDRSRSEEVSQEILESFNSSSEDGTVAKKNVLIVVVNEEDTTVVASQPVEESNAKENNNNNNNKKVQSTTSRETQTSNREVQTSTNGYNYTTIATVNVPKIDVKYAVLEGQTNSSEETVELLRISPIKFWGPDPNEIGNFCIVGHNYRNNKFFSKVPSLENGDIVEITDTSGRTIQYKVYNKYTVDPTDVSCTTQLTNGRKEVTLITCTDDSKNRVVVRAREIK